MITVPSTPIKSGSTTSNLSSKQGPAVKIGEASKILGFHIDTLRRWEKSGKIKPIRTPGGTRLYLIDELTSLVPKVLVNSSQPAEKKLPIKNLRWIDEEDIYAHVYNKGVENRIIFNEEKDYRVFQGFLNDYLTSPKDLSSIKQTFKVHGRTFRGTPHQPKNYFNQVELIAYSITTDQFHLLLHQKAKGSLENFIRSLCTRYSMYFNKKYKHSGSLFEGPYKSVQVKDEPGLLLLTHYLHHDGGYSSYAEYLGSRVTPWVNTKVVQSFFDKVKTELSEETHSYKDFVEKYELNQKENELLEGISFKSETEHLERQGPTKNNQMPDQDLKPRSIMPDFLVISAAVFFLLFTLGIGNIKLTEAKNSHLPTKAVLGETREAKTNPAEIKEATSEAIPKTAIVKINDDSPSVNIRQQPTVNSEKIGQAKDGDTFELISQDLDWFKVKLASGSAGFISAKYIEEGSKK